MKLAVASLALLFSATSAFQVGRPVATSRSSTSLSVKTGETTSAAEKVQQLFKDKPAENEAFDKLVKKNFPGAISNKELATRVVDLLGEKKFDPSNTLLCTSLCADELARVLEDEFVDIYGNNFNLGGLSGFPFAGNTGWGAMSAHVPDDGYCLVIHGPHVGISKEGVIGKVERSGIALVDNCCGSAIAASNYLKGITDGGANITPKLQQFSDFQQGAVQELILPFGKRLARAEDRMRELPYALYDSQEVLVTDIVNTGKGSIKKGLALLGGIQINTSPDTLDYFHPLRFDYYDENGNLVENMLPYLR
mmetsp:Transcript_12692/g.27807  ORF Transcript_12692/g.27807 Transcript_12692/m.27807 type:complete len:308 (+) Transcript_12692:101-1024(+)